MTGHGTPVLCFCCCHTFAHPLRPSPHRQYKPPETADHAEATVEAFESAIRARPEVVACYAVTGDMDFLVHVFAPDLARFSDFALKALLRMPGVKGTKSAFIMQAVKNDLAWAPETAAPQPSARARR